MRCDTVLLAQGAHDPLRPTGRSLVEPSAVAGPQRVATSSPGNTATVEDPLQTGCNVERFDFSGLQSAARGPAFDVGGSAALISPGLG